MAESDVISLLLKSDATLGYGDVKHDQIEAWATEVALLQRWANQVVARYPQAHEAGIAFEYSIPRREKRIDAIVVLWNTVVVLEFKVGTSTRNTNDVAQVADYALDLTYYHEESARRKIVPVLCATESERMDVIPAGNDTPIEDIQFMGGQHLAEFLTDLVGNDLKTDSKPISIADWVNSSYRPIPGVIEATVALFAQHDVSDINKSLSDSVTINRCIDHLLKIIETAQANNTKVLCLLTGVPGAGKSLTGLQVVHSQKLGASEWRTVFLSGNGPLLKVLKAALARDYAVRQGISQVKARIHAESLLHSVHSYLGECSNNEKPPAEHIVIFDEAQRAWDGSKMEKRAKIQRPSATESAVALEVDALPALSEPHQILSVLDRHQGGAVIALCGHGQEIHDGEAGVQEWISSRNNSFAHWQLRCSNVAAQLVPEMEHGNGSFIDPELHLDVPLRSHRATMHAKWVDAVTSGDADRARPLIVHSDFPILLTRNLDLARQWLFDNTAGTRRAGLLASSGATRLRHYGLEVSSEFRKGIDYGMWFTAPADDLRSSMVLEVAATEFECQGLELDRVGVCWGWDLLLAPGRVEPRTFRGTKWNTVSKPRDRQYIINKYRVLLTRAREGMIIWVPRGSDHDSTRNAAEADAAAEFFQACGATVM